MKIINFIKLLSITVFTLCIGKAEAAPDYYDLRRTSLNAQQLTMHNDASGNVKGEFSWSSSGQTVIFVYCPNPDVATWRKIYDVIWLPDHLYAQNKKVGDLSWNTSGWNYLAASSHNNKPGKLYYKWDSDWRLASKICFFDHTNTLHAAGRVPFTGKLTASLPSGTTPVHMPIASMRLHAARGGFPDSQKHRNFTVQHYHAAVRDTGGINVSINAYCSAPNSITLNHHALKTSEINGNTATGKLNIICHAGARPEITLQALTPSVHKYHQGIAVKMCQQIDSNLTQNTVQNNNVWQVSLTSRLVRTAPVLSPGCIGNITASAILRVSFN